MGRRARLKNYGRRRIDLVLFCDIDATRPATYDHMVDGAQVNQCQVTLPRA